MIQVLDAHALVWFLEGSRRLGAAARGVLSDPNSELVLPIVALAEACWVVERGRSSIRSVADLLTTVYADPRITLVPLDRSILDISVTLTSIAEMHDRQIVATALDVANLGDAVALLTRDQNIMDSGVVPVVW